MHFIDLKKQQARIKDKIDTRIQAVLAHGKYIMGPEINELEQCLAEYVGVKRAISCSSGTDALLLVLLALKIGPGDAVLTTPFTFIATAEVVSLIGATPVFVDIDPKSYNIDPGKLRDVISEFKTASLNPKAIMGVDLFGLPADYDEINAIAKENSLYVIEDAAQSFGGEYKGRKAGSLADVACTSFFPAKPLGCYGDGGMCFTNDDGLAEIMNSLRIHGKGTDKYDNVRIGVNGRMDTLQAAITLAKFEIFPEEVQLRQKVAENYKSLISCEDVNLIVPEIPDGYLSAWAQYSILAENADLRSHLQEKLKQHDIPTAIYYPKPLHLQSAFANLNYKPGDFPVSEDCANRIFSLPMHPYLTPEEQQQIIEGLAKN